MASRLIPQKEVQPSPMRILQRYILLEFLTNLISAVAVFTGLMLLMSLLQPLRRGFTLDQVVRIMHLYIPYVLTWSVPMSVLTAAVTTFAKFAESGELTAVQTCGVHVWQIMKPAVVTVAAICVLSFLANATWIPKANLLLQEQMARMAPEVLVARLQAGHRSVRVPPYAIDIKEVQGETLRSVNIRVSLNKEGTKVIVLRAPEAVLEAVSRASSPSLSLMMLNGTTTLIETAESGDDDSPALAGVPPREWTWAKNQMTLGEDATRARNVDEDERSLSELVRRLRTAKVGLLSRPDREELIMQLIEVHKRLSLSLVSLVFVLLGAPLGMLCRKSNRLIGFASGLGLALGLYYPLLLLGISLAKKAVVNPCIGLWFANVLFIAAGCLLSRAVVRG